MIARDLDRQRRWEATATTWLRKTVALLRQQAAAASNGDERWLVGYDASHLFGAAIDAADELLRLIPDDLAEEAARVAGVLARRTRDRVLAAKLEGVEGRTPEEAAAFLRRAAELRAGELRGRS